MALQVVANSDGSWTVTNDRTGEHFTAPDAQAAKDAIEAYNQGLKDKEEAKKAEEAAASAPQEAPAQLADPLDHATSATE